MAPSGVAAIGKLSLCQLADRLLLADPTVVSTCVDFIIAESEGLGHGRARAKMCRRLKHHRLSAEDRARLVHCITERLRGGRFGQQFRDQLRLALALDRDGVFAVADACLNDPRAYVRRQALSLARTRSTSER